MASFPRAVRSELVAWCRTHAQVFAAQAAQIGLTPAQAAAFADRTAAAAAALDERERLRIAAQTASRKAAVAIAALKAGAGETVALVRAFAGTQENPDAVLLRAELSPRAARAPAPPPAQPRGLAATLEAATGTLTLTWKARQPRGVSGTTYLVRRRLPGARTFTLLGLTGGKRFTDAAVPGGVATVQYTVTAQRGGKAGPTSAILQVNFGAARVQSAELQVQSEELHGKKEELSASR